MLLTHNNLITNRHLMSRRMDGIMDLNDSNIQVYRTKLKAHYTMLLTGQEILSSLLTPAQLDDFAALRDITLDFDAITAVVTTLVQNASSSDLKDIKRSFELASVSNPLIVLKKIAHHAFGAKVARRNENRKTRDWKVIDVKMDSLRAIKERYNPGCLCPEQLEDHEAINSATLPFLFGANPLD